MNDRDRHLTYRPEIDGLRAVAVIPVVLFHSRSGLLPGGFIGVDVFFVISGFLITSLIREEHARGTFRFANFWGRRVRRILPALIAMIATTLAVGAPTLYAPDVRELGQQGTAALLSVANVSHWLLSGDYWGPAAEGSPFLHTWSLSVEEQFYLLFPLLMIATLAYARRPLWLLAALTLASAALFVYGSNRSPYATFYLLPTRAWELGAGACAAIALANGRSGAAADLASVRTEFPWSIASFAGLVIVIASYALVGAQGGVTPWMVFPVLGTVLILVGARGRADPTRRLLSTRPAVYIGRISYSMYLWHWPMLLLARQWALRKGVDFNALPVLAAIFAVSSLSYHCVEVPTRHRRRAVVPILVAWGATLAAAGLLAAADFQEDTSRFSATHWDGHAYSVSPRRAGDTTGSRRAAGVVMAQTVVPADAYAHGGIQKLYGGSTPEIVVIGDSHALMWGHTLDGVARELKRSIAFFSADATPAFFDIPPRREGVGTLYFSPDQKFDFDRERWRALQEWRPAIVIISSRWSALQDPAQAGAFLEHLAALGTRAILVEQPPELFFTDKNAPQYLSYLGFEPVAGVRRYLRNPENENDQRGVGIVKQLAASCARCERMPVRDLFIGDAGVWVLDSSDVLYIDDNHLSRAGAEKMRDRLRSALGSAFEPARREPVTAGATPATR